MQQELVLLLAGTRARRAEHHQRCADLAGHVSHDGVFDQLARHRLVTALGPRLVELGASPPDLVERVGRAVTAARLTGLMHAAWTAEILGLLEAAGIDAMPLKGVYLAESAYGDIGARSSGDIDVLVARDHVDRAVAALEPLGYRVAPRGTRSAIHITLESTDELRPAIEVHWRVHWYGDRFAGRLLARSTMVDGVRTPEPAAGLAALLLFYARDGFTGIRLAADISAFADRQLREESARRVLDEARHDPEIATALHAAARVARELVGLDVGPPPTLSRRRDRLAVRLANWHLEGEADQIRATMRLTDLLLAPAGFVGRFVGARFVPFERRRDNARHTGKTLLRWLFALSTVTRGRVAHPSPFSRPSRAARNAGGAGGCV